MDIVLAALPSVVSGISVAVITLVGRRVTKLADDTRQDWTVLKESQRNQLKSQIVVRYQEAQERGFIRPWDLESITRMAESYYRLGGNSYIHSIMDRLDKLPIKED